MCKCYLDIKCTINTIQYHTIQFNTMFLFKTHLQWRQPEACASTRKSLISTFEWFNMWWPLMHESGLPHLKQTNAEEECVAFLCAMFVSFGHLTTWTWTPLKARSYAPLRTRDSPIRVYIASFYFCSLLPEKDPFVKSYSFRGLHPYHVVHIALFPPRFLFCC